MYLTISGFYEIYKDKLTLLCGGGGMTRRIRSTGILDYEFLPQVRGKYWHSNFQEEQLVITTFLYARDNEFLVNEAVKNLITKGCSGLIIKNVFRIRLHDTVLRYADAKNFPIFVSDSTDLIFEEFVYDVTDRIRRMESLDYVQRELDAILADETTEQEAYNHGLNLNPSFENQHRVFYMPVDTGAPSFSWQACADAHAGSRLDRPEHLMTMYDEGILFIQSWEGGASGDGCAEAAMLREVMPAGTVTGISEVHYYLGELKQSLQEAIYAARAGNAEHGRAEGTAVSYGDLGAMRILLPYCRNREMQHFSEEIMGILEAHDLENKGHLTDTLAAYCEHGCRFAETAEALGQHENTIRYRMDKISELTGYNYKESRGMQVLDLAWQIRLCAGILEER